MGQGIAYPRNRSWLERYTSQMAKDSFARAVRHATRGHHQSMTVGLDNARRLVTAGKFAVPLPTPEDSLTAPVGDWRRPRRSGVGR